MSEIMHVSRMWFGAFLFRSLWLSLAVAIFWVPVLIVFGYGMKFLFEIFQEEPIALGMVLLLSVQPILVLLAVFAMRGGLLALGAVRGTELNALAGVAVRIFRFNLPLSWVSISLFGLAGTLLGLRVLNSDFLEKFQNALEIDSLKDISRLVSLMGDFPILSLGGWIFGICVTLGLLGVPTAATSAMASVKPPNHHSIWGAAAEFTNLFLFSLIVLMIPFAASVVFMGPTSTLKDLSELDPILSYAAIGYVTWSICALAAASALAYSITVKREAIEYEEMMEQIAGSGSGAPTVDLKALRDSRMKK